MHGLPENIIHGLLLGPKQLRYAGKQHSGQETDQGENQQDFDQRETTTFRASRIAAINPISHYDRRGHQLPMSSSVPSVLSGPFENKSYLPLFLVPGNRYW